MIFVKKFLGGLLLVVLVFGMTACGSKDKEEKKASDVVGTYKMVEMSAGDEKLKAEDLEEYGLVYTLEVKKDKTAVLSIGGEETELKYDDKYFFPEDDEDDKVSYKVDGKKLTVCDDDTKMVFEKE